MIQDIPTTHTHQWHEHRLATLNLSLDESLAGFETQIQGQLDSILMEFYEDLNVEPLDVAKNIQGWETLNIFQKTQRASNLLRSWQASRNSYEDHLFNKD
jgi:muramoyltetrapeptide carboxypeptidase LdcA involved in peptidoglycan recycling